MVIGDSTLKKRPRTWRFTVSSIKLCVLIMYADKLFTGFIVNGQVLQPIEANSSPSSVTAKKGSSVWLHWNYTYIGDGIHSGGLLKTNYSEQVIGFNSPLQTLAKRIGHNGSLALESSIPVPFKGRVEVISSNSTLVIHNLQYNDSAYQFSSTVNVYIDSGGGPVINAYGLRPNVNIRINGIPGFIKQPPSTLDVTERSSLQLQVQMDGNPNPSADFRWSHLIGSSPMNVLGVQLYPFVYSSTYTLNSIDARYCGRVLETTIKNSIGSSSFTASTNITVLLKLDMAHGLKAGKIAASKCVEVQWNKAESGACYVKYETVFKDATGNSVYNQTAYNIGKMMICKLTAYSNITDVQLTVSFKATSKTVTAKVSDTPITTPPPTLSESFSPSVSRNTATASSFQTPGSSGNPKIMPKNGNNGSDSNTGLVVGASVGGAIFVVVIIIIIVFCIKKPIRTRRDTDSRSLGYPLKDDQYAVVNDLNRKQPLDPTNAFPKKSSSIDGKLGKHASGEYESGCADLKLDAAGYPAAGAVPTSYTDGNGGKN